MAGKVSETTLKRRTAFLVTLADGATDISFLNDTDRVLEYLKRYSSVSSRWNYLMHIHEAIKCDPSLVKESARDIYSKEIARLKVERSAQIETNVKSAKQEVTLKDGLVYEQSVLRDKIKILFASTGLPYKPLTVAHAKKVTTTFAQKLQDLVYLALWLFQPALRSNWATMHYTTKRPTETNANYLYQRAGVMTLFMNQFKNAKVMGQVTIPVRDELRDLLLIWFGVLKHVSGAKPMFVCNYSITQKGVDHVGSDDGLARHLPRVSERELGKPLGVNDFRHLWEIAIQQDPAYAKMSIPDRDAVHRELLHGRRVAELYNVQDSPNSPA